MNNQETFKEFKKLLPKDALAFIMRDKDDGTTDFMAYDTTRDRELTVGYLILRGVMDMVHNEPDILIERGQLSVFKDLQIKKPVFSGGIVNDTDDNVVHLDFEKD